VSGSGTVYLVYENLPERIFKTRDELLPEKK
jgi:hypothetical protein